MVKKAINKPIMAFLEKVKKSANKGNATRRLFSIMREAGCFSWNIDFDICSTWNRKFWIIFLKRNLFHVKHDNFCSASLDFWVWYSWISWFCSPRWFLTFWCVDVSCWLFAKNYLLYILRSFEDAKSSWPKLLACSVLLFSECSTWNTRK